MQQKHQESKTEIKNTNCTSEKRLVSERNKVYGKLYANPKTKKAATPVTALFLAPPFGLEPKTL